MKNLIFGLVIILSVSQLAVAQETIRKDGSHPKLKQERSIEEMAQHKTKELTKRLELTPDQQKSVYEITLSGVKEMRAARVASSSTKREQMKMIKDNRVAEIKKVLTSAQIEKMEAFQDRRKKKPQADIEEKAIQRTNRLQQHLRLNEEQRQQVLDINLRNMRELQAIKKIHKTDRSTLTLKRQEIEKKRIAEINEVLNDEQQTKFKQIVVRQPNSAPESRAKLRTEALSRNLGLDETQYAKISEINNEINEKIDQVRVDFPNDRTVMKEKIIALNQERNELIRAELNETQIRIFDRMTHRTNKPVPHRERKAH